MKLIVNELKTAITQEITRDATPAQVAWISVHLYRHRSPAGSVKLQILDANQEVILESAPVTIASIGTGTWFHNDVFFQMNVSLAANTVYYLRLVPSGYTFSENAYLGWCNGFDQGRYEATYPAPVGWNAPLDFTIWTRQNKGKGTV
jgi:hypothetical protein